MNILKLVAANKEGIIKKTLIAGGTIIGLALAAGLTSDAEAEETCVCDDCPTGDCENCGEVITVESEEGETKE